MANYGMNFGDGLDIPKLDIPNFANANGGYGGMGSWGGKAPSASQAASTIPAIAPELGWFEQAKASWNGLPGFSSTDPKTGMKTMGKADYALGGLSAAANAFMAMKNYGLMKDQFNFQKDAWGKEYDAQKRTVNSRIEDRQERRNADFASGHGGTVKPRTTADYMATYGIK